MTAAATAIVVAAGSGERLGADVPKALVPVGEVPMLVRSVRAALGCEAVTFVVIAAPEGREDVTRAMLEPLGAHTVVAGGLSRQASVRAALGAVDPRTEIVVVHDAARPFATPSLFAAVIGALEEAEGAIPVVPLADTVKRVEDGWVVSTPARDALAAAQTPQAFRAGALREAHRRAADQGLEFTDDAGLLEWAGYRVRAVEGVPGNFTVTTAADLDRANELLRSAAP
ncbi:MAG: 2-C-methyl-D-erythritol 4-phosphate cytidylyltransferase [Actinomycetota bacterium]